MKNDISSFYHKFNDLKNLLKLKSFFILISAFILSFLVRFSMIYIFDLDLFLSKEKVCIFKYSISFWGLSFDSLHALFSSS